MLPVEEVIQVDELAHRDTMLTNSKCLNSRSMSNNRCEELNVSNPNMPSQGMEWVAVDRLPGRACTTMFPSQMSLQMGVMLEADSRAERAVEAIEDQRHHQPTLQKPLPLMLLRDRRMPASLVPTIVEAAEGVNEVSIHTLEDKQLRSPLINLLFYSLGIVFMAY